MRMKNLAKMWLQKNPKVFHEPNEIKKVKAVKAKKAPCPNCDKNV